MKSYVVFRHVLWFNRIHNHINSLYETADNILRKKFFINNLDSIKSSFKDTLLYTDSIYFINKKIELEKLYDREVFLYSNIENSLEPLIFSENRNFSLYDLENLLIKDVYLKHFSKKELSSIGYKFNPKNLSSTISKEEFNSPKLYENLVEAVSNYISEYKVQIKLYEIK